MVHTMQKILPMLILIQLTFVMQQTLMSKLLVIKLTVKFIIFMKLEEKIWKDNELANLTLSK